MVAGRKLLSAFVSTWTEEHTPVGLAAVRSGSDAGSSGGGSGIGGGWAPPAVVRGGALLGLPWGPLRPLPPSPATAVPAAVGAQFCAVELGELLNARLVHS